MQILGTVAAAADSIKAPKERKKVKAIKLKKGKKDTEVVLQK